ncbi:BMP family lipoprotein [Anoxynatronum buryatiense]|uniref:Basic membrane lipoprotein Med, substrate-binding protein (PBP1-ABC) superfamily n=1 Tax=Anoxynatronum buryatiense TaxID=489973 RepID=A0AA45WV94_9CLOT|nr:BMP family ABC transporter substrate-binding protein [Anoxynatronum buryatiense]SMP52314.1 Basic membrane lipoprotein Med, substrate-binding protein (PBP1-ABC) superfamily [Anoxynatronum buryatiense]
MKKSRFFALSLLLVFSIVTLVSGCASPASPPAPEAPAAETAAPPATPAASEADFSHLKVALISDPIGTEQFILQAYHKVEEMAGIHGFQWTSMECSDTAQWEENGRAAANEGYDLVIGVGWQAAEPFSALADEFDHVHYAVIDAIAGNDKVTSIGFNETEGCYVLGVMIGTAFPDETLYGYVGSFQTQATYKYRYGFSEGVKSVNPDAEFMYNYTNSYSDTSLPYEYTTQQQAAGATFIFGGVAASANAGIYQAALDLAQRGTPVYTTGLSVDQTTPDNPYIIGGALKNTGSCTEIIISQYLDGTLSGGAQILGLKENAFGVVHVTTDTANYLNEEMMPPEAIEAAKAVAAKIIAGELEIIAPEESAN